VAEAMVDYLYHHNANTHWNYPSSQETDAMLLEARARLADLFGASPADVSFGNNMTTITFHLSRALGREWGPGDEVVVTELDHHANVAPWRALERERGITVRTARMDPRRGVLDWQHLGDCLSSRTRLLAIGAASNALGTITDIPRAVAMARHVGALTWVDAVHYAAHGVMDAAAWGCDFLVCSPYKFYGPHTGVLCARPALLDGLDVPKLTPAPDAAPERVETGTQNHEGMVGSGAVVEFLASLSPGQGRRRERVVHTMRALHRRGDALFLQLWEGLHPLRGVTLYGLPPGEPRTPTLAMTMAQHSPAKVAIALAEQGVFVSDGDFYAATVIERLGRAPDGVVRIGCACYTTEDEVARLIAVVRDLAGA
jgi:cysteine desulfurase family protein (TIGR01976 family)